MRNLRQIETERASLLRKYVEERDEIQARLYRLLRFACELEINHQEIERLSGLLKPLSETPWSVRHELEEIEKRTSK